MIKTISIKNLAIIENIEMNFSSSFNVLTGETGAGKSIIIKAISLCLGNKASNDDIRDGCATATVTVEFVLPTEHAALEIFHNSGVPVEGDNDGNGVLLIRRLISRKGRPQAWVNDVPVTVGLLRGVGLRLVEICGQHENQRLAQVQEHGRVLDQFLTEPTILGDYETRYKECFVIVQQISELCCQLSKKSEDIEYWIYRKNEIDELKPSVAEYEEILRFCQNQSNGLAEKKKIDDLVRAIDGHDMGHSLSQSLWHAAKQRCGQESQELSKIYDEISSIAESIDDLSYKLNIFSKKYEVSLGESERITKRLELYRALLRKNRVDQVEGLLKEASRIDGEIAFIEGAQDVFDGLISSLDSNLQDLEKLGERLSSQRRKAAKAIEARLRKEFLELGMEKASIKILFGEPSKQAIGSFDHADIEGYDRLNELTEKLALYGKKGRELISFGFLPNPGEPVRPLAQIASGGEMSRIMLALKKSLAIGADTCVLVFDEIDVGISGRVADKVGRKLLELGNCFQVLVVSHLPQVAAYAGRHFLVEKIYKGRKTRIRISQMTDEQREAEIGRLLSGEEVTKESLDNAQALLQRANVARCLAM